MIESHRTLARGEGAHLPVDHVSGGDPYAPQSGDVGYRVESYDLTLDYRVRTNRLEGSATLLATAEADLTAIVLDLVGLRAARARVDGAPARFSASAGKLRVVPPRTITAGDAFAVEVVYGRAHEGDLLDDVQHQQLELASAEGAPVVFAGTVPLSRAGSFGYTVRVVPKHPLLASPAELGLVAVAE